MSEKQGELFPEDKPKRKPSTNKRAVNARRRREQRKSDIANQSENERMLNRQREEWDKYNEQVQRNRAKLRTPVIDPQDDWQTNPNFNRDRGGWDLDQVVGEYFASKGESLGDSLKVGDWDPNKARKDKKIRELKQRAGTAGEKAAAENKQTPSQRVDLPNFGFDTTENRWSNVMTIKDMSEALERENIGNPFDKAMDDYRRKKGGLTIRERIEALKDNKKLRDNVFNTLKITQKGLQVAKPFVKNQLQKNLTRAAWVWALSH